MVRGVIHRVAAAAGALTVVAALMLAVAPVGASAAPRTPPGAALPAAPRKAPKPDAVTITGQRIKDALTIRASQDAELFAAIYGQVSWLADAPPQISRPDRSKLGDRFTLTVLIRNVPQRTYDVYPSAKGGPRAYRPAKQPRGRKVTAGWFYGRLSMPETMRLSGVPLPERRNLLTGGIGGGERGSAPSLVDGTDHLAQFAVELRKLMLLNGAVVLVIAIGLAGASYLIRRKV